MAAEIFAIDLSRSWLIGDKASDLQAGINAGLAGGTHVYTRYLDSEPERKKVNAMTPTDFTVMTAKTVLEASRMIDLNSL
jgi:histidinol phosphatase-like enzyme